MFKFRTSKFVTLLLAIMLMAAACGTPTQPAETQPAQPAETQEAAPVENQPLRVALYAQYIQWFPLEQALKDYQAAHPDFQYEFLTLPAEEQAYAALTQKLQLEAQQQKAPYDVIFGPTPFIEPSFLGKLGLLEPLDSYFPQETWNDVYPSVLEEIKYTGDGKIYTYPFWTDIFGTIYRPSMLKEATGSDTPPATWDEILEVCKQVDEKMGDNVSCFGGDWKFSHRLFMPILGTYTDKMYDDQGVIILEGEPTLKTLNLIKDLYQYMPANAAEALGSSKTFQANGVALEVYWQTQMLRAIQANVPADDVRMTSFPKGTIDNTIFWTAGAVIPKYAANKEGAITFIKEILHTQPLIDVSMLDNYKIVPFKTVVEKYQSENKLPVWAPDLIPLLEVAQPIPSNEYYLSFEQTIIGEELEKMLLSGQSPEDTQANMVKRLKEELAKAQ
ncbi:MAG: extracellular solute-binding protein [Chloroflexota bacterium]|nr:MAG: extracellular solute-binding protein [Chloroflexota bacterium]